MVSRAWKAIIVLSFLAISLVPGAQAAASSPMSPCIQAYGGLKPDKVLEDWLRTEVPAEDLATTRRYDILAGNLLKARFANGSSCPSSGLNLDGSPNGCGVQVSQGPVNAWQNRYDSQISAVSTQYGVPAKLVKAMIAVESQFWPVSNWAKGEIGFGQLTNLGADLLLTWEPDRYRQVCQKTFDPITCSRSYRFLDPWQQASLRGYLLSSVDATCPTCSGGIDPARGEQQIQILVESMNASCQQTGYLFRRATGSSPSTSISYGDFWKTVLANYHAGSGCLFQAMQNAGRPTSWSSIAARFPQGCMSGSEYIRRVEEQIAP